MKLVSLTLSATDPKAFASAGALDLTRWNHCATCWKENNRGTRDGIATELPGLYIPMLG